MCHPVQFASQNDAPLARFRNMPETSFHFCLERAFESFGKGPQYSGQRTAILRAKDCSTPGRGPQYFGQRIEKRKGAASALPTQLQINYKITNYFGTAGNITSGQPHSYKRTHFFTFHVAVSEDAADVFSAVASTMSAVPLSAQP